MTEANPYHSRRSSMWDQARREYLAGMKATAICQRYGMSMSSFRLQARTGGWRRIDRPECGVTPEDGEFHRNDQVSFTDLAEQAFLNIRRALATGRAAEASSWMRLYDKLADRARPEVMSDLPDAPPPVAEDDPLKPMLYLTANDPTDVEPVEALSPVETGDTAEPAEQAAVERPDNVDPDELDSLDSVFSESNPPTEAEAEAEAEPADPLAAFPDRDYDGLVLLRGRRLELGMPVRDIDAALERLSRRTRLDPETPSPPSSFLGPEPCSDGETART